MKFLFEWFKQRRKDKAEDELVALLEQMEKEQAIPSRDKALARKFAANTLRSAGTIYHQATLLFLRETRGTREEFDQLPPTAKEAYLNKARGL